MINCIESLLEVLEREGARTAIRGRADGAVTFAGLHAAAARAFGNLAVRDVAPGDTVLLAAAPSVPMYATMIAILARGASVLFIEPWLPLASVAEIVRKTRPSAFVSSRGGRIWSLLHPDVRAIGIALPLDEAVAPPHGGAPSLEDAARYLPQGACIPCPDDRPASIVFSSGTAGHPKGIVRTHPYVLAMVRTALRHAHEGLDAEALARPDLALFSGMTVLHLFSGRGSILVPSRPRDRVSFLRSLDALPEFERPSTLTTNPAFLATLLDERLLPSLRAVHIGGAPMDTALAEMAIRDRTNVSYVHVYGCSEAEPIALAPLGRALEIARAAGDMQINFVGKPIPELRTKVDAQGLWVAGESVATAYVALRERDVPHKARDDDGLTYHLTNDRIVAAQEEEGAWRLHGRTMQDEDTFLLQRRLYVVLGHTDAFAVRLPHGARLAVGRGVKSARRELLALGFDDVHESRVRRDARHASRVDVNATLGGGHLFARLWRFSQERAPLPALTVLAAAPALAAGWFSPVGVTFVRTVAAAACVAALLFATRLGDEIKDYTTDCRERPARPLPRGLLSLEEAGRARRFLLRGLLLGAGLQGVATGSPVLFLVMVAAVVFLWLLARDFFLPGAFEVRPVRTALLHQTSVVPLYAVPFAFHPLGDATRVASYVMVCIASSLAFEFARKLDPGLPRAARTYERVIGFPRARAVVLASFALLAGLTWFLTRSPWVALLPVAAALTSFGLRGNAGSGGASGTSGTSGAPEETTDAMRVPFTAASQLAVLASFWSFLFV